MSASQRMRSIGFALAATIFILEGPHSGSAEVMKFNCTYQKFYNATDKTLQEAKDFKLQFTIDTVTNKAVLIGNQGMEEVTFVSGAYGVTFLRPLGISSEPCLFSLPMPMRWQRGSEGVCALVPIDCMAFVGRGQGIRI
jgi:hypothetical protein